MLRSSVGWLAAVVLVCGGSFAHAQGFVGGRGAARPAFIPEGYDDHQNMMDQLGIKSLRPGKSGNNQTGKGFDEATANDWMPTLPDVLKMNDGKMVTTPQQWPARRAEIVQAFESEMYGRIPANVPKVTWEVTGTTEGTSGTVATVTRTLVGHVDNSAFPQITVNIQASFTVPANAAGPVPVLIEFGGAFGGAPGGAGRGRGPATGPATTPTIVFTGPTSAPAARGGNRGAGGGGNSWTQQAIAHGWGYGFINPASIQADSGGNALRQGIVGLTNKGEPRKPDDWGALRAWGWGVSQLINYFEAHPEAGVDPKKLGIEGVSRYGKASLVAAAFDERIAVAFVASSGQGGAKLSRHDMGESVENLAGGGEYHWMAGNYLKYATADSTFGAKDASNLPVDSHELIAMVAPRLCFISYGIEPGDPKWVDARGSYMAGILAGPVYRLLGKKDFGVTENFITAPMPAVGQLVGGDLAWRQHEGGHTSVPNFPAFFDWVGAYIQSPAAK